MYAILNELLSDKKGGATFSCFGIWHLIYIFLVIAVIISLLLILGNKSENAKMHAIDISLNVAFGLYILDFFLMPFAYGEIDLEKFPFHICTAMCVMSFLSRHNKFLYRFRFQFAILGFISNFVYFIYPAGVGWYQIHPLSYRVIQTLIFHATMMTYGLFVILFEIKDLKWKDCLKELIVLICMTLWALLGNILYNGTIGEYSHNFNWFFVLQDPFYLLPKEIAPYLMPFVTPLAFFIVTLLVYIVYFGTRRILECKAEVFTEENV